LQLKCFRSGSFALLVGLAAPCFASAQPLPSVAEVLVEVGEGPIEEDHHDQVVRGEVVVTDLKEVSDRELAVGVACLVTRSPAEVLKPFLGELPAGSQAEIEVVERVEDPSAEDALNGLTLGPEAREEAERYVTAQPGYGLNLSGDEIATFAKISDSDPDLVRRAEATLKEVLRARLTAYHGSGLDGTGGYARDHGQTNQPSRELHRSYASAKALSRIFPMFARSWDEYPEHTSGVDSDAYFWIRARVDGRPSFLLTHRMEQIGPDRGIVARRSFYFSHFFDAGFSITGTVKAQEGSLFFFVRRIWVDRWSGMASIKRKLGHKLIAGSLRDLIEEHEICH
jgi:hypothetical protein